MFEFIAEIEAWIAATVSQHHALQAAVLAMFAAFNSVRIVAYVPQMVKAARDTNGASAISCATWGLFLASHLTTILYAIVCLADLLMAMIFLGNAIACLGIILLAMRNRRRFHLRRPQAL